MLVIEDGAWTVRTGSYDLRINSFVAKPAGLGEFDDMTGGIDNDWFAVAHAPCVD